MFLLNALVVMFISTLYKTYGESEVCYRLQTTALLIWDSRIVQWAELYGITG